MIEPGYLRKTIPFLVALATTILPVAVRADQAIVVGIQKYPYLSEESNYLEGCVNDAGDMATALKGYGFKVTPLTNEKATKQAILRTIASLGGRMKPEER